MKKPGSKRQIKRFQDILLFGGSRTPFGCFRWNLSEISAVDLAVFAIKDSLVKSEISLHLVDSLYLASVLPSNQGQNLAKQAALKAGKRNNEIFISFNSSHNITGIH